MPLPCWFLLMIMHCSGLYIVGFCVLYFLRICICLIPQQLVNTSKLQRTELYLSACLTLVWQGVQSSPFRGGVHIPQVCLHYSAHTHTPTSCLWSDNIPRGDTTTSLLRDTSPHDLMVKKSAFSWFFSCHLRSRFSQSINSADKDQQRISHC